MKKLTGLAADQLKELILEHLQGEDLNITALRLEQLVVKHRRHASDLFQSVDVIDNDPFILAILGSLNLDSQTKSRLLQQSLNLYELLEESREPYLDILLERIDQSHPSKTGKTTYIGAAALLGTATAYQQGLLSNSLPVIKSYSQQLLSRLSPLAKSINYWPLLGAVVELFLFIKKRVSERRLTSVTLLSEGLPAALSLAGFSLWAAATGLTPMAAGFLMASSGLSLLESGASLMFHRNKGGSAGRWQEFAANLRDNWVKTQLASMFKTRLLTTLITGATLAAVLINPAFTLAGLLILSAAPLAEGLIGNHLKRGHLETLQDSLRTIETPPDVRLCPSTRPAALSLLVREKRLCDTEVSVRLREAQLLNRETLMQHTLTALEKGAYLRASAPGMDSSANEPVYALHQETIKGQDEVYDDHEASLTLMNQ